MVMVPEEYTLCVNTIREVLPYQKMPQVTIFILDRFSKILGFQPHFVFTIRIKLKSQILPRQIAIFDAVRGIRSDTEPLAPVRLIVRIVAIEPVHLAIAFKRQDVRGNAI
jgi:hypothetical protein